jgi:hypothetical protein
MRIVDRAATRIERRGRKMRTIRFSVPKAAMFVVLFALAAAVFGQATPTAKIGERGPAGGIIFYDKGSISGGWRYLEAAPKALTEKNGIQWCVESFIEVKTGVAVGAGKSNTDAIIAAQGSGSYAASLCKNLAIKGFSDWFLPSKDELNLMYTTLKKAGLTNVGEGFLWSSSQYYDNYYAWSQKFSNGTQEYNAKDNKYSVWACRSF